MCNFKVYGKKAPFFYLSIIDIIEINVYNLNSTVFGGIIMSFEQYFNFYNDETGFTLRKGQSASFTIDSSNLDLSKEHKLFVTGDTALFYGMKTEPDYPQKYRSIEDALDNENAYKAQYGLNLSVNFPDGLVKRIYKRLP